MRRQRRYETGPISVRMTCAVTALTLGMSVRSCTGHETKTGNSVRLLTETAHQIFAAHFQFFPNYDPCWCDGEVALCTSGGTF
jgi:hypothetical protein